jgi:hypothetical protein
MANLRERPQASDCLLLNVVVLKSRDFFKVSKLNWGFYVCAAVFVMNTMN